MEFLYDTGMAGDFDLSANAFGGGLVPGAQGVAPSLPFGDYGTGSYTLGTSILDPSAGPQAAGDLGFFGQESGGFVNTIGDIARVANAILPGVDSVARNIKGLPPRFDRFAGNRIGETRDSSKSLQERIAELDQKMTQILEEMSGESVDTETMESDDAGVIDSSTPVKIPGVTTYPSETDSDLPDLEPEPLDPTKETDPTRVGIDRSGMYSSQDAEFLRSRGYTVYTDANGEITGYETPQGMPFRIER